MQRAQRAFLKLADTDEMFFPSEEETAHECLLAMYLDRHGADLAAGTVSQDARPGAPINEMRVTGESGNASMTFWIDQGEAETWESARQAVVERGARAVVADLSEGANGTNVNLESISGFGRIGSQRGWQAEYFGVDCPIGEPDAFWSEWSFGAPIEQILEVLDAFAAKGWQVVRVSEDRGLYQGEDSRDVAGVTTMRHWLVKA